MSAGEREYDLIVYGATGFVGKLLAEYLAGHAPDGLRVALAGRSQSRLEQVRSGLPVPARSWPIVVADATDHDAMQSLAASTRVVATTVGPYHRYGLPLVLACAAAGTHYADLTGEVLFVRGAIEAAHTEAVRTGARLVVSCGFDSVPSDLGVHLLHQQAQADGAGELGDTTLLVTRLRGGLSGGTLDSMRSQLDAVGDDRSRAAVVFDPFALTSDRRAEPRAKPHRDILGVYRDQTTGQWTAPFVMAPYNTRVVRRSNSLRGQAYGPSFRYREAMAFGVGMKAKATAIGLAAALGGAMRLMANPRTRTVVDQALPAPGEGPSEEARTNGRFRMELRTTTTSGQRYLAVVAAKGDPGYAATAVMLGESALCLALDEDRLSASGGVLTPAVAMGDALVERLRHQGFTLTAQPEIP